MLTKKESILFFSVVDILYSVSAFYLLTVWQGESEVHERVEARGPGRLSAAGGLDPVEPSRHLCAVHGH